MTKNRRKRINNAVTSLKLPEDLLQDIEAYKKKHDCTKGHVIRVALKELFNRWS